MSLNLSLALFEGLRAVRQNYELGNITYEQARQQTEQNVRKAFYGILVQEGSLSLAEEKLEISENRLRQTSINYRNGLVPELSYLQTQLAVETQKPALMETRLNLEQQKNLFAFLIGLPIGTVIELSGEIEPEVVIYDEDEMVNKYLLNNLDIAILRKNIDLLNTQRKASAFQRFTPAISISQSFAPYLSPINENWFNGNNWTDSGSFSVTLAFDIMGMMPFSTTGQTAADTKDNIKKLELNMQQLVYNTELQIRNLVQKLEKSKTAITAMELNVAIAEKAYRLTDEGYRAGTIEYLDLKDAENTMMQAKLGVLGEKFTYMSTLLDLETVLNTKLN
ncbi:TolC family protein [Brucepastera parasyntrophica]|uniref:TolC family protein n=1 Tax=Brucepastera parasyntrophica TaxID=2880008 RepID=UPI0021090944|nr:TolC family protein [Brucepastera parasyntrophica]